MIFFYSQMPWFVMTQIVIHDKSRDFFFVVFCYFVLSYRDEQAGNIGKRNFSLSAFSEKLVQTCTKSVIVAAMLLKLTTEGFLICRKQTNKQGNKYLYDR